MPERADTPVRERLALRSFATELALPARTEVLRAREPEPLADVWGAVRHALAHPVGAPPLAELCREVLAGGVLARTNVPEVGSGAASSRARCSRPSAVVVVSDNTRPVPYKGEEGILWPLLEVLFTAGFAPKEVTLLVATGTHRVMSEEEIWAMLGSQVRQAGVRVACHDAADKEALALVGRTTAGADVFVDRGYVEADLRVLTGLVEPHLVAGFSGGRKSICPGLVNVQTVRDFHGPRALSHPLATALCLEGNPCHAISLEIGGMAPADFIVNVTAREDGRVAGVFAGHMELAHLAAVRRVEEFVRIPLSQEYDVVVVHGGMVGVNHYQTQKAADVAVRAVRPDGYVVLVADTTDRDPVGTASYRRLLRKLADMGPAAFLAAIQADDWQFAHDQWGVQIWAKLFDRLPVGHFYYYSPQTAPGDFDILPGVDPLPLMGTTAGLTSGEKAARFVTVAIGQASAASRAANGRKATVAYLAEGPHGVPEAVRYAGR